MREGRTKEAERTMVNGRLAARAEGFWGFAVGEAGLSGWSWGFLLLIQCGNSSGFVDFGCVLARRLRMTEDLQVHQGVC